MVIDVKLWSFITFQNENEQPFDRACQKSKDLSIFGINLDKNIFSTMNFDVHHHFLVIEELKLLLPLLKIIFFLVVKKLLTIQQKIFSFLIVRVLKDHQKW